LPGLILRAHQTSGGQGVPIDAAEWNGSRYFPVPTIVQAASAIFANHDVKDLANSRAGIDNLETTQNAVIKSVRDAMQHGLKKLLVITGVPGHVRLSRGSTRYRS
jgi:hypothetical protein